MSSSHKIDLIEYNGDHAIVAPDFHLCCAIQVSNILISNNTQETKLSSRKEKLSEELASICIWLRCGHGGLHFNGPQTKFIGDSLYKHPVFTIIIIFCLCNYLYLIIFFCQKTYQVILNLSKYYMSVLAMCYQSGK